MTSSLKSCSKKILANKNQSGITLLLSILFLAAILAISFSIATILFIEIRTSGDLLRTESSYYGSQGVTEEALFKIKKQVSLNYSTKIGNVSLSEPAPVETQFTEPIFQDKVNHSTTAQNTPNRYPLFNPDNLTGGSGYSYVTITRLPSGNADPLIVYICEFDPNKSVEDYYPPGEPCTSYDSDNSGYWNLTNARNYSLSNTEGAHSWFLHASLQQQIIIANPNSTGKLNFSIQAYSVDGTSKGIPYSGKTAVKIVGGIGGISRKITVVIPDVPGRNAGSASPINFIQGAPAVPNLEDYSMSFPGNVTAGHTIVAGIVWSYPPCPPGISDSQGNIFTQAGPVLQADPSLFLYWFTAPISATGPDTVTISAVCGHSKFSFISEYSGLDASPFDASDASISNSSPCSAGSVNPSQDGELILGVFADSAGRSFTPGAGFTQRVVNSGGAIAEEKIEPSSGLSLSATAGCSANGALPSYGFMGAFKAATGNASGPTGTIILQKNATNGNGIFNFTTSGGPSLPGTASLGTSGGSGSITFSDVNVGTYSIAETIPGGWALTSASCDDGFSAYNYPAVTNIQVTVGAIVTCTFNNTYTAPNNGYAHYRRIDVDGSKVISSNQNSFPLLVCFNGAAPCDQSIPQIKNVANGGSVVSSVGDDIIFTSDLAGTNLLPFEREKYVAATGEAVFWVNLSLNQGSPTTFYMFYGKGGVTNFQGNLGGSVWNSNFKGVYHLSDGVALTAKDSTNSANGTVIGAVAQAGKIDGSAKFNGTISNRIDLGSGTAINTATNGSAFTISAWVNPSNTAVGGVIFGNKDGGSSRILSMNIWGGGFCFVEENITVIGCRGSLSANTWQNVTWVYNNGVNDFYINAVKQGSSANHTFAASYAGTYFFSEDNNYPFPGSIDEVRISNINRSAGWIATEYNNQSSPSTFYSVGAQQP